MAAAPRREPTTARQTPADLAKAPTGGRRTRIAALIGLCAALPCLLGALSAPRQRLDVDTGGGAYRFVPVCSSQVVQVRHGDAQLRLASRHGPLGPLGGDMATTVDAVGVIEHRQGETDDDGNTVAQRRLLGMLRAQFGVDWTWLGVRLGAAAGGSTTRTLTGPHAGKVRREFVGLPAASLRLGHPAIHLRAAMADGAWALRYDSMTFGVGFALGDIGDASHDVGPRGFVGFSSDMRDGNDGYAILGVRLPVEGAELGLLARAGRDGSAGALTFGLPLR